MEAFMLYSALIGVFYSGQYIFVNVRVQLITYLTHGHVWITYTKYKYGAKKHAKKKKICSHLVILYCFYAF